jgi:hypothetical protein
MSNPLARAAAGAAIAITLIGLGGERPAPARESGPLGRIILVPIDDRPAVGQFAQMIGAVADHEVIMPPESLLGRFTQPGDGARIEAWLRAQDYSRIDALIVSVDMLAYGGLIASRAPAVQLDQARGRLAFFGWFKRAHPQIPIYAFNAVMRVAPTASRASRRWREALARWAELEGRAGQPDDPKLEAELAAELEGLRRELDPQLIADYRAARARDLAINLAMIELVQAGAVDQLILLQDDARPDGLHRRDQERLRARLRELGLEARVPIYNGTDEGALSLVSRAIIERRRIPLRVAVIYSSERSRGVIAPYEDRPLEFTVESQLRASGARLAAKHEPADYTLYVNAPQTGESEFADLLARLSADLRAGRMAALSDVLFPAPHRSGADERIIAALGRERLLDRLTSYAAWNTAGNTLGTAIPHANLRVISRRLLGRDLARMARAETAHLAFLLHRLIGDYLYHDRVRLAINRRLRDEFRDQMITDELPPEIYQRVNREVERELGGQMRMLFDNHFRGRAHPLAELVERLEVKGLEDLRIRLPWPRTFEVRVEYRLTTALKRERE